MVAMAKEQVRFTVEEFPHALERAMEARNFNPSSLSRRCGVSPTAIRDWLRGESYPGAVEFKRLTASLPALGVYREALARQRVLDRPPAETPVIEPPTIKPEVIRLVRSSATEPNTNSSLCSPPEASLDTRRREFGVALHREMAAHGLTGTDVATLIECSSSSVSNWTRGASQIQTIFYRKLIELMPRLAEAPDPRIVRPREGARLPDAGRGMSQREQAAAQAEALTVDEAAFEMGLQARIGQLVGTAAEEPPPEPERSFRTNEPPVVPEWPSRHPGTAPERPVAASEEPRPSNPSPDALRRWSRALAWVYGLAPQDRTGLRRLMEAAAAMGLGPLEILSTVEEDES